MAFRRIGSSSVSKKIDTDFSVDGSILSTPILEGESRKTSKGTRWKSLRGSWTKTTSGSATSLSASSTYPMAVVDALSPNVAITLNDIGNGSGASFWVTDAGNWWGVGTFQQPQDCNCSQYQYECNCTTSNYECNCSTYNYSCNCSTYTYTCNCVQYTIDCNCTTTYTSVCDSYGCNNYGCKGYGVTGYYFCGTADRPRWCPSYGCSSGYGCTGYGCQGYIRVPQFNCQQCPREDCNICEGQSCQTCQGVSCQTCQSTTCQTCVGTSCQTCYPQYVRILQSSANTISTVVSWTFSSIIRSLKIRTLNKRITVEAFSDVSSTTKIDTSKVYDSTTATPTTTFGLLISPSSYNETKNAKSIKIERNKQ